MIIEARRACCSEQPPIAADAADFGARVRAAEAPVFVYRAGCAGIPTRLESFADRAFAPGADFDLIDGNSQRGLAHIRRLAAAAVHEQPRRPVWRSPARRAWGVAGVAESRARRGG